MGLESFEEKRMRKATLIGLRVGVNSVDLDPVVQSMNHSAWKTACALYRKLQRDTISFCPNAAGEDVPLRDNDRTISVRT